VLTALRLAKQHAVVVAHSALELLGPLREKCVVGERVTAVEQAIADLGKET